MMVGVPVLLVVCDSALVPPVWVMVVGEGCSGWCVFQYWVAVVWASSVVPGVPECLGVVVAGVVVAGVVVFWWFRMLTCLASFFFLGFVSCLFCLVWLITGCPWVWCVGLRVCGGVVC